MGLIGGLILGGIALLIYIIKISSYNLGKKRFKNADAKMTFLESKFSYLVGEFDVSKQPRDVITNKIFSEISKEKISKGKIRIVYCDLPKKNTNVWKVFCEFRYGAWGADIIDIHLYSIDNDELENSNEFKNYIK